ncbi:RagB/SusD family nutrient uptake outer membrane protein [Sphingobacterium bovistauri]|uniref:RagB/SusD family nutrient uptake outer membrane protein n=1 Tax=Sphingobacterium bovistauri TaxID=2781959 RepID=A0ABS7Z169_9SPHI|nr:RagB/SusD family nutrient uptake outer membrane protein [Sphingobacterium bovistauri]MCA5003871.1 RagB/SusD family nutrient uptake outer membrane protein [Sphingobacterium bovistauri]
MKKLIFIYGASLTLMLSSCEKFLDLPPQNGYNSENIFDQVSRAEMALEGAYTSTFSNELYYQFGMGTDECISIESETNSKNQVSNYVYNPATSPTSTYTSMYSGVEQVNVLIKGIEGKTNVADNERAQWNQILGEAYAIRAKNMLNVVRFFGDVPYPRIPVVDAGTFTASRVSRDTILDGCVSDLQKAIELLPWKSESTNSIERFNKNSAYGILARVALYAAGYSLRWDLETYSPASVKLGQRTDQARVKELYKIARDAAKAVIDRGENDLIDYETVFRDVVNGKYNKESMLEYAQKGLNRNNAQVGYTNGFFAHQNSFYAKAAPQMIALPSYYFEFEEGDKRRDVAIANYSVSATSQYHMNTYSGNTIGKFRVNWKSETGPAVNRRDINWIELRFSDILLMFAEADNEFNNAPSQDAKDALKRVRLRAFKGDASKVGTIASSYQDFRNAIIQERKLELGFEGWRRTDLIRWGILAEKLAASKQEVMDLATRTGRYANADLYRAYKRTDAKVFLDPKVALEFVSFKSEPTSLERSSFISQGYTIIRMHSNESLSYANELTASAVWVKNIFRGLEKNKSELFPLNTSFIDNNPGLRGQQHPLY